MRRFLLHMLILPAIGLSLPIRAVAQDSPSRLETVAVGRAIGADAYIKVWVGSGSVRVVGWDADSLTVTGRVDPGDLFLFVEEEVAKLGVEGELDSAHGEIVVRVPESATVWIRTGSAAVVVREHTGSVDIHTVSGAIDVRGRPAHLYAESMAGDLTLHVKAGIARARTATGRITLTGTVEDLTLNTVSGTLQVDAPNLRRGRFTTVDGDIDFTGDVRAAGSLGFETHSGAVALRLPYGTAADFELATFEGRMSSDLGDPSPPTPGPGQETMIFGTGTGDAEITVRTFSGGIRVLGRD